MTDVGFDPDTCDYWPINQEYVFADQANSLDLSWSVETNVFGHYVVFDGDESQLTGILSRIASAGIGVKRYGPSHRPADDGHQYDWFIRLDLDGDNSDVVAQLKELFAREPPEDADEDGADTQAISSLDISPELYGRLIKYGFERSDSPDLLKRLLDRIDDLSDHSASLIDQLDEEQSNFQTRLEMRSSAFEESKLVAERERQKSTAEVDRLRADLHELEKQQRPGHETRDDGGRLEVENARLRQDLQDQELLMNLAIEAENKTDIAHAEHEKTRREAELLGRELEHLRNARGSVQREKSTESTIRFAEQVLKFFSRINFHADAAEIIVGKFEDPSKLFAVLQDLETKSRVEFKSLKSQSTFLEVQKHISTGRDSRGRIYYKSAEKDRIDVYVHWKEDDEEQDRVIRKLDRTEFWGPQPYA